MEDMHSSPVGPQLYLLSEEGYEGLKHIQAMLTLMAHITCNEEHDAKDNATLTIGRAELCFIFQTINVQIGDVLERLGNENWLSTRKVASGSRPDAPDAPSERAEVQYPTVKRLRECAGFSNSSTSAMA